MDRSTGFSSEIGTKLRDWAIRQAGGSCYSRAALSSNDSKTLYLGYSGLNHIPSTKLGICQAVPKIRTKGLAVVLKIIT